MKRRPHLCIGMSLAPTWLVNEGWRAPDSRIEELFSIDFALEIAKACEAAKLDFVFRPDASFLPLPVLEQSFGFASLDPTLLVAALARETRHIGLMTTISTTFADPYTVARQIMSLQWMSQGRAGWNVVTGLDGHFNFSMEERPSSEARHARASEFVAAVRALWDSFPHDALLYDREGGRYADTSRIRPVSHQGGHFHIEGPLNIPRYPQAHVPLMQAGGSPAGMNLAGEIADMVFAQTPDIGTALRMQADLGAYAGRHGRAPEAVRLLPGLSLYLAQTRAEAEALFFANHRRVDPAQLMRRIAQATGLDLAGRAMDAPITAADLDGLSLPDTDYAQDIAALIRRDSPRLGDLLASRAALASVHWQIIGTVDDAAAQIVTWFEAGAVDGFIAVPGGARQSFELTVRRLIPALTEAGLFRQDYDAVHFDANIGLR